MAAAVLFVIASIWSPANMAVLFEMRKPVPDGDVIAKLAAPIAPIAPTVVSAALLSGGADPALTPQGRDHQGLAWAWRPISPALRRPPGSGGRRCTKRRFSTVCTEQYERRVLAPPG